jgi:DNA-binding Xre family transcriptional regulator
MTVSEQLKQAIERRLKTETLYRIAKESGVAWRVVQRFMTGERPQLRSASVDKLCDYLGLELKPKKQRKTVRKRGQT